MAILLLIFLLSVIIYFKSPYRYWKKKNVTGPTPIPIFGNVIEGVLRRKNITDVYFDIYNKFPNEKVVGIYAMTSPVLLIRDLEIVKQILVKDFNCFSERGFMISKSKLGNSLFHCDTNVWKDLRNKMTPFFTSSKIKTLYSVISERSDVLVEHLENKIRNQHEQELCTIFRRFGIDVMLTSIFNLNVDIFSDKNADMIDGIDKSIFVMSFVYELSMILPNFMNLTKTSLFGEKALNFCNDIIDKTNTNNTKFPGNGILKMLQDLKLVREIQNKNEKFENGDNNMQNNLPLITDDIITSQVFIIWAAGYENANLSLSYALYNLAANKEEQDKLIKEIDTELEKHGDLSYDALNNMKYLDKVFNETLRLHPLANTLQRVATKDYTIPDMNLTINKGTIVLISTYAIHRDEKYFTNAMKFDPDRFNTEHFGTIHSCAFLPFGAGPRSCFGYRLTKLIFKTAMVKILSKFYVKSSVKTKKLITDPNRTMMSAKGGIYINFIPR